MSTFISILYWIAYGAVLGPALLVLLAGLLKTTIDLWNEYFSPDSSESDVEPSKNDIWSHLHSHARRKPLS